MTALAQVRRARVTLMSTVIGASILWAVGLAAGLVLLAVLADLAYPLAHGLRRTVIPAALVGAVGAALVVLWRGRHARTLGRVALYLEERLPALQYTLATSIEPASAPSPTTARALTRAVDRVSTRGALRGPMTRALAIPAAGLAIGLGALALVPAGLLERVVSPRPGDILLRPVSRAPLGSRLAPIAVRVTPPAYTRREERGIDDPASVAALVGSRIDVFGRGASAEIDDRVAAALGTGSGGERDPLPLTVDGDEWRVSVVMRSTPAVVQLTDRTFDRLLVLEPVADEPPVVTLTVPPRDTILPVAKGKLALTADLADDIGLGSAEFEILVTSGGGERFETRQVRVGRVALGGVRSRRARATIGLDTMRLKAGDVVHLRAIARDENDVTGPGRGESETRTIRIFDARARQSVNITPAKAAALDTSILSQRMLIIRAETLLVDRPRIPAEQFSQRSLQLSVRQGDLRRRVESIVYDLENVQGVGFVGETPTSKTLREAAVAMQDAETELSIARPDTALPHMRRALKLLEQARDANRYWLRGLLTTEPIEVDRVRLTGTDKASPTGRNPREHAVDLRQALLARLDRVLILLETDPDAGKDSLRLVLVAALSAAKDVAGPLGEAVDATQRGRDPMPRLVQVRRRLERRTDAVAVLSPWLGHGSP